MAAKARKEGHDVIFVEIPTALKDRLQTIRKANGQTISGAVVIAVEKWVRAEERRLEEERLAETPADPQSATERPKGKRQQKA